MTILEPIGKKDDMKANILDEICPYRSTCDFFTFLLIKVFFLSLKNSSALDFMCKNISFNRFHEEPRYFPISYKKAKIKHLFNYISIKHSIEHSVYINKGKVK